MAQLMDIVLVVLAVGSAMWAVVKYFINLGRSSDSHSGGCSCDNGACNTTAKHKPLLDELKQLINN